MSPSQMIQNIGKGMITLGAAGIIISTAAEAYFEHKTNLDALASEYPEFRRLREIGFESTKLKHSIFDDCLLDLNSKPYDKPQVNDCLDQKVDRYFSLQQETEKLMQSEGYKMVKEHIGTYSNYIVNARRYFVSFGATFVLGLLAYGIVSLSKKMKSAEKE